MSTISTHVLDTVLGRAAAEISVRLERQEGSGWTGLSEGKGTAGRAQDAPCDWIEISAGVTDADGRCRNLARDAQPGVYRITFETGAYFARSGRTSIYPEISIAFLCDGKADYHLPLLLSGNSYTTYRGS
jgi:5-hydroxyisourate hydrolase